MTKPDALTFTVPLPPRELHPNARVHFLRKNAEFQAYAAAVRDVVARRLNGVRPAFARAALELVFVYPDRRRRDLDGALASCKALFDGLVQGGAMPDDCWAVVPVVLVSARCERGAEARVEVTVKGIEAS